MQIFQLQHPATEIILCDNGCDLRADFLEVTEDREYRLCPLHTHSAIHVSKLPQRAMNRGLPFRSRARD